ncbi:hypothetical protein D9M70_554760 [compost metagenome]
MPAVLSPEYGYSRFALSERCYEVGFSRTLVGGEMAGAYTPSFANAGINDNPIQMAEALDEVLEYGKHLLMVIDVQSQNLDPDAKGSAQFLL